MKSKLAGIYWRTSTAVAVLATGIVLSAAAAVLVAGQLEREARLKFESAVSDAQAAIESRIKSYADVLGGIRGLLIATESVNRDQFGRYLESLDLNQRYPGIQVIHYSRRISAAQKQAFEAMVRGDTSVEPRGYPNFAIRPPGERAEYVVAVYVEPMAGAQPLGVMEFFSRNIEQPDEPLLQVVQAIGNQIGQFVVRRQAEERVRHLAHYDELTTLPNRSMFHQRVGHALAHARRNEKVLAILFIDLDRFKNINDTLGHDAGDRVLKETADRLRGCLRESDTVGRLGGDEFVVLIEELAQPVQIMAVAQKILAAVARPIVLQTQEVHVTASIGISTYPADSEDLLGLMKSADIAMYRAKEQGKNNYQFYSAQMNVHTLARLAMESDLRRALQGEEFLLHFQPKVDIASGRIAGVEALVRWQQPARGLIAPAQFIPLAEEIGLIVPIGEWVMRAACARNKSWQDQGLPRLRMAVNLSARQFAQENLVQDVARILSETGLSPAALEFEITESMVMSNPQDAVRQLDKLKDMGITLSIDDFGTGYSSLSYLKRLPIDSVKIDGSFIRDLPGDADDAAITQAIISMAHGLKLKVIAEGVETEEQLRFLREHGCDEMQGYWFSKPLPEGEFLLLLQGACAAGSKPAFGFGNRRARASRS